MQASEKSLANNEESSIDCVPSHDWVELPQASWEAVSDARPLLPKAAFFMGDLRDGLPMVRLLYGKGLPVLCDD